MDDDGEGTKQVTKSHLRKSFELLQKEFQTSSTATNCCSVGIEVASDTRDPRFASSHGEILLTIKCIKICIEETNGLEWLIEKRKTRDIVILKEPNAIVEPVFDRYICRYKSIIPRYIGSRVLYQGIIGI